MTSQNNSEQTANEARIRIFTHSNIRYEGTLYKINPVEKTIALKDVMSFGTENRPSDKEVLPSTLVYEYLVFRSSEIKDLIVLKDEQAAESAAKHPQAAKARPVTTESAPQKQPPQPSEQQDRKPKEHPASASETQQSDKHTAKTEPQKAISSPAPTEEARPSAPAYNNQEASNQKGKRPREDNKPKSLFNFDDMVKKLELIEKAKEERREKADQAKYNSGDFFDSLSTSVGTANSKMKTHFQGKASTRETFGSNRAYNQQNNRGRRPPRDDFQPYFPRNQEGQKEGDEPIQQADPNNEHYRGGRGYRGGNRGYNRGYNRGHNRGYERDNERDETNGQRGDDRGQRGDEYGQTAGYDQRYQPKTRYFKNRNNRYKNNDQGDFVYVKKESHA